MCTALKAFQVRSVRALDSEQRVCSAGGECLKCHVTFKPFFSCSTPESSADQLTESGPAAFLAHISEDVMSRISRSRPARRCESHQPAGLRHENVFLFIPTDTLVIRLKLGLRRCEPAPHTNSVE